MKNKKVVADELLQIKRMTGLYVEDIQEYLDASKMSYFRFLDVADIHRLRTEGNLTCMDCIFKNVCMKKPLVRMMLLNYMEKDISSIEGMKGFCYL